MSSSLRLLLAGAWALLLGCSADEPAVRAASAPLRGWSVILVNVDTLRADHLGAHGYFRDTSPFFDARAREGILFENAIANSSYTRESVATLLTGRLPSRSGAAGWLARPGPDQPHLGPLFRDAGYRTGFFSNTVQLKGPGFTRGFEVFQHLPTRWDLSGMGERLSDRALEFVRSGGDAPFFLYLHYLDPHAPYAPRPQLLRRFAPVPFAAPLALYDDVEPRLAALRAEGFGPGDPRFEDLVARYDAEIASTDAALARLFAGLESAGWLERTLVVVTADHGEEFLEHGSVEHAWTLYQEVIHVPLLFWAPAALAPARVAERVSALDVLPSLIELLGLSPPGAVLDGVSLFDGSAPRPPRRPQIAELLLARRNVVRAVLEGDWKYLAAWRWVEPEDRFEVDHARATVPLDSDAPIVRETLFDLARDPGETTDRSAEAPDRLRTMRRTLEGFLEATGGGGTLSDPPGAEQAPALSPEDLERLRALGYRWE